MSRIYVGAAVSLVATFTNPETDAATDPSSVTCESLAPGATTATTHTVTKLATGRYEALVTANKPGIWTYRFEGTGTRAAASEGTFRVAETDPRF